MNDFGLYIVITNPLLPHVRFSEICVEEEVPMLQLREKHLNDRELLKLAKTLKSITAGSRTKFVINDRADLAILAAADGLHIGPADIPLREILTLLPKEMLLGISSHSITEAMEIIEGKQNMLWGDKPDYLSFGPVYTTPTKEIPDTPQGVTNLKQLLGRAVLPIVAIGGIFPPDIPKLFDCGTKNIAMVRYFTQAKDASELKARIRQVKLIIEEYKK